MFRIFRGLAALELWLRRSGCRAAFMALSRGLSVNCRNLRSCFFKNIENNPYGIK